MQPKQAPGGGIMRLFNCGCCGQRLYFENVFCTHCEAKLGFLPDRLELVALEAGRNAGVWRPVGEDVEYRECENSLQHAVCNWMVPVNDSHALCTSCRLNTTIPDLNVVGNLGRWRTLETEKRRLVYALLRLGLPLLSEQGWVPPLAFAFLADTDFPFSKLGKVLTGHEGGLITINLKEADPAERERLRGQMDEPYRTLLGHFRHESGHYYWDQLIRNSPWLDDFRSLFGNENVDYDAALEHHYRCGAPADWQDSCISSYATMHPWEDWAETWAHYLHMVDTMETAWQFNLSMRPTVDHASQQRVHHDFDPYLEEHIETLIEHWLPLTFALNSLNRSMGHEHAYPFVLSSRSIEKLAFVHRVIRAARPSGNQPQQGA
jgi:hypothetical protein